MPDVPTIRLANGIDMPILGFGTWPLDDREAERMVAAALDAGYRLIDTAEEYGNEPGVGRAIRTSGIDPQELFVTTKFNRQWHGVEEVQKAWAHSVERLGLERIDLLLIHWPNPGHDRYVDAWRGMLRLLEEGKVRAVGVSNFTPTHLQRLIDETGIAPHVNQIQLNPHLPREEERRFHEGHRIVTESWGPIGSGRDLLRDPVIETMAREYGKTPAQVVLHWHVQLGLVVIPRTSDPSRLRENLDVFDLELTSEALDRIATLDRHGSGALDPESFGH
ncbi:MAG TPA: aldo/keto reductase [Actinomycetota bacterium]|nr:aldo/keto reductase [Actinomycetota bacterium]